MSIRDLESSTIRAFLLRNQKHMGKRVLDYGAGRQPYRDIVEAAGAEYVPYDSPEFPGSVVEKDTAAVRGRFDAVICTQVLQYCPSPDYTLRFLKTQLHDGGSLLMTGPTNWPLVEEEDLWRFTPSGVVKLLAEARFTSWNVVVRAAIRFEGENWATGWEAVVQA